MADNPFANLDQYKEVSQTPSSSVSPDKNPFANIQQYNAVASPEPAANAGFGNSVLGYLKDTGKGIVRGGASLLDMLSTAFNPTTDLTGRPLPLPGTVFPPNIKTQKQNTYDKAKEAMPYEHPIYGQSVEGAVAGVPFGGLAGATIGAIASGGTEALNTYNPGHPIANTLIPMGAGLVAGPAIARQGTRLGKIASEGLHLTNRPALVQAERDLGITAGTAASNSDNPFWSKMQRGLRERILMPKSSNIEQNLEAEQHQLGAAVQKQADSLFPSQTKQQLGQGVQSSIEDGVDTVKRIFSRQEQALDNLVNPNTTTVNMIPHVDRAINEMASTRGAHIPLTGGKVQSSDKIVTNLMENIIQAQQGNNQLSVAAIRELKQKVGDQLKESLLNGNANKRELQQMYGVLADAQGEAYGLIKGINPAGKATYIATTPQAQQYQALKAAEAEMYSKIDEFAQPLIKQGITPEKMADLVTNQMKLGGTKLAELVNVMSQASPSIRNQLSSSILQNIGKNNKGEFVPDRFFTRWQQIAPEAKQALFGQGPNQDIPKIYDQLALVATNQARGAKALNTSGTAGTAELYHEFRNWGMAIGGLGGLGWGAADMLAASRQDQAGNDDTSTLVKGAGGAGIGAVAASILGPMVIGRMMTNPAFLRWIATPTIENIPMHAKALSAIAAEYPDIGPAVTSFQEYIANKQPQKFAMGGPVNDNILLPTSSGDFKNKGAGFSGNTREPVLPSSIGVNKSILDMIFENKSLLKAQGNKWPNPLRPPQENLSNTLIKHGGYRPESPYGMVINDKQAVATVPRSDIWEKPGTPYDQYNFGLIHEKANRNMDLKGDSAIKTEAQRKYEYAVKAQQAKQRFDSRQDDTHYAQGGVVDRASQATSMLQQALGLQPHQASGAVKYMNINESRLDPNIVNPTSGAYGVAQWLGPRKQALFGKYGPKPSFEQQINHIIDELKGPENKTFQALVGAKNEKEAYDIWGSMFERPGAAALAKAGVAYRGGTIPAMSNSSSIIDQFLTSSSADSNEEEENTNQPNLILADEKVDQAASMGADPLVQSVIRTIWSTANV